MSNIFSKYKIHAKSMSLYLGSSLFVSIIGIAINPFLAKNLSHEDYAIIGYYSSFTLLLTPLLSFNLIIYYLRNYYLIPEDQRQRTSDTILLGIIGVGLTSLTLFTIGFYIYSRYQNIEFPFFPYAILAFSQIFISNFSTFYLTRLRISRQAKKFAIFTTINGLVLAAMSVLLVVYFKYGADGKMWGALIGTILMSSYAIKQSIGRCQFDITIMKKALKFGLPLTLSALLWYFLSGVDRAFLVDLNDTYTYGTYSVAIQISSYLTIFYTAVANTFEPDIFQSITQKRTDKLIKIFAGIIGIVTVANLTFIALAPYLIDLLTAGRYIASTSFAQILALHNITMACYYVVVKMLIGYGYVKTELTVRIIGAIICVIMFKLLIAHFGFYGAAWGQVCSFLILTIIGLVALSIKSRSKIS